MFAAYRSPASSYRQVAVETSIADADPHRLIAMLFDAALESIARARRALASGDIAGRGEAITRALRIIEEGLKASLDDRGGEITRNLRSLYGYMLRRLLQANRAADDAMLAEVAGLVTTLRDAWAAIAPDRAGSQRQAG